MITLRPAHLSVNYSEHMAASIRILVSSRNNAIARMAELQDNESEILHELERPRCLYDDRARLATQLQKILAERRQIKDWLRNNKPLFDYLDSDKGPNLQRWLDGFIGAARKAEINEKRAAVGVNAEVME